MFLSKKKKKKKKKKKHKTHEIVKVAVINDNRPQNSKYKLEAYRLY